MSNVITQAATPIDPNGLRFSHPYYDVRSVPYEVWIDRVSARHRALDNILAEQRALACSAHDWKCRATADADDESVQSERDDLDEIEGEQEDHLDRYKSRARYHQEIEEGIARVDAEELERASAKDNRVVKRKKQPKLASGDSVIDDQAFIRAGNDRLINIFDQAPVQVDEDDVVNVSRLSFARPTFSTEEEEPASPAPPLIDNRWRPDPCVIAAKWTDPPGKKHAEQRRKNTRSLTPAEERELFEILQSGRGHAEYNRAWSKVIEKYRPLIWSRVRYHSKSWPSLVPDEVYAYTVSKIFEHKKIDKFNPNRGRLATLLRAIVKNCFIDYTRAVMVPAGLVGRGLKDKDKPSIRAQSFDAVDDSGVEFGELLDASNYGPGLFPDLEVPTLPNDLLTPQEYQVISGLTFAGKSVTDLSKEMNVSTQRIYQLKLRAEEKIKGYMISTSDSAKRA
jgi:hypothetical protein